MDRNVFSRITGFAALILLTFGALLYAIDSPNRETMYGFLICGGLSLVVFVALNRKAISLFSKKRSSRYGANMFVMILLFMCIVVIIQALSSRHSRRFDMTRNQRFSLAGQTISLLNTLDRDIDIHGFFKRGTLSRRQAEDLISQYQHENRRIRAEFIDPDQNPQAAKDLGATDYDMLLVQCGARKELIGALSEESLTNAILKVFREEIKAVYLVQGHGEKDPDSRKMSGYSSMKQAVEADNYYVKTISLFDVESVPDDCYLLMIAGPTKDYIESEIDKIKDYLSAGKSAIVMIDPQTDLPNIQNLLAEYRIAVDDDIIIDPYSRVAGGDYKVPLVSEYDNHPITRDFDLATFYPLARSVRIIDTEAPGSVETQYLVRSGTSAWGEIDMDGISKGTATRNENDVLAPVPIAAVASKEVHLPDSTGTGFRRLTSKIIVFGDSDFANNSSFRILGNADFLLNTVSYLAEEKDLIAIRPKQSLGDRLFLTASQGRLVFLVSVVLLPAIVITIGTSIFLRRKKSG
ncbi:MAG: GldG family protein [Candidatus Latescibacterota bacterium]